MADGSWKRAMERDAVKVAFPDWEWRDDDLVEVRFEFIEDGINSTFTFEADTADAVVGVARADGALRQWRRYERDEIQAFWVALMAASDG